MASTMGRSENACHVYMVSLYYVCFDGWPRWGMDTKKGQAYYIAPLQPDTVAPVKAWRSSRGAGRVGLTRCKVTAFFNNDKRC